MPAPRLLRTSTLQVADRDPRRPGVAVWQVELRASAAELDRATALLTPAERRRADRGTPTVRDQRVLLRAALRRLLGQALGCHPADVPLGTSEHGRPELQLPASRWDASCSRAADLGLIAVARDLRVGVDVEQVTPWTDATAAEGWLSPREADALRALPPAERARAATDCWTQKEAVLKAVGTGLTLPPAAVPTSPGRPVPRSAGWVLTPLRLPPGFAGTLASSGPVGPGGSPLVPLPLLHRPQSRRTQHELAHS